MPRITPDATSQSITVHMTATDGTDHTTLLATNFTFFYRRGAVGSGVGFTPADLVSITSVWQEGGVKHVLGGNYRVDLPNAAVGDGVDSVVVFVSASGAVQTGGAAIVELDETNQFIQGILGAPVSASMVGDITSLQNDTTAILADTAEIGTAGIGLSNLGGSSNDWADAAALAATQAAITGPIAAVQTTVNSNNAGITLVLEDTVPLGASIAEVSTILARIPEAFVFTVTGQVDANVVSINETAITGNGTSPKFGV